MEEKRNVYIDLVGKTEGRRPFGIGINGEENMMDFIGTGWEGLDWINLAQVTGRWCAVP
jgi:hypothetical protein